MTGGACLPGPGLTSLPSDGWTSGDGFVIGGFPGDGLVTGGLGVSWVTCDGLVAWGFGLFTGSLWVSWLAGERPGTTRPTGSTGLAPDPLCSPGSLTGEPI